MTNIRPAIDQDVPLLPEIERSSGEIFRQWPGLEWIADDDIQSEEQHHALNAYGVAQAAELQGHGVVGFLNGEMMTGALHIWQIAVHRDWQRRGIGRQLIEAAEQLAAGHGVHALTLTTFRKVAWNERYYQRLGFVTLDRETVPPELQAILDAEVQAGLPAAQRCTMRKTLQSL
jgi:GNAT superfamily N-acetyltransferase